MAKAVVDQVYRHYKNDQLYVVKDFILCTAIKEKLVVYENVVTGDRYGRHVDEFEGPVSDEDSRERFSFTGTIYRPSTDKYFMDIAHAVSARGTCSRRKVGAIAVIDGRIVGTGYNGSPSGTRHCGHEHYPVQADDPDLQVVAGGRLSCSRAIHAEANVMAYAAHFGVALVGSTFYVNTFPCHGCFKQIVTAGVKRVVYDSDYFNDKLVNDLAKEAEVQLVRYQR